MSKRSIQVQETMYCGIDVSAKSLTVAIRRVHQAIEQGASLRSEWAQGSYSLAAQSQIAGSSALEATGIYSLDLAFALDAAEGIEVDSLESQGRQSICSNHTTVKNGRGRCRGVAEYTHRMPFTPLDRS